MGNAARCTSARTKGLSVAISGTSKHHKAMGAVATPALNDFDQARLWENLIGAETRAQYFGVLSHHLRKRQRLLTGGALVASSGAAITFFSSAIPNHAWIKGVLALVSAVLNAMSLVSSNEKSAIEAADLSYRWQTLASSYRQLWSDMYSTEAPAMLQRLAQEEALISKSSTALPNIVSLMTQAEDNVIMHAQASG